MSVICCNCAIDRVKWTESGHVSRFHRLDLPIGVQPSEVLPFRTAVFSKHTRAITTLAPTDVDDDFSGTVRVGLSHIRS